MSDIYTGFILRFFTCSKRMGNRNKLSIWSVWILGINILCKRIFVGRKVSKE